jgi:light-regulated signal transduction histidine kinase (bacteriophytochrome)
MAIDRFEWSRNSLPLDGTLVGVYAGVKTRIVRRSAGEYCVIAVSSVPDHIKSKKLMEAETQVILTAAQTIDSALQRAEDRTRRLLHNLKSLTAKTSQEIFYIAQQDRMLSATKDLVQYVASEIKGNHEEAAKAFIEILKHQAAQKAEYSAFEKLTSRVQVVHPERHDIHRVLMNVFYLFFSEFLKRKAKAEVDKTRLQAVFDYDSIHVCIYYIVENASKYIRPASSLNVTANESDGMLVVRFSMESLTILPNEVEKIFEEGFSGSSAVAEGLHGAGIGLYLARAMAKLNAGNLTVIPGRPALGSSYARNTFILALPLKEGSK